MIKNTIFMITAFCVFSYSCQAKSSEVMEDDVKTKVISIKKGQSMDLLSAIRKSGTDEALNTYFSHVFPPATKHGFKVDASFVTIDKPTKGNYHSDFFSIMSWPNEQGRENFLEESKGMTYDYVTERRNIWSVFNLTQYDYLDEDVEITCRTDKVYVITSYWVDDMDAFVAAKKNAGPQMKNAGGKLLATFGKGLSPNGYLYEPDVVSITEWDSKESFENYLKSTDPEINDAGTKNVNQWMTQLIIQ